MNRENIPFHGSLSDFDVLRPSPHFLFGRGYETCSGYENQWFQIYSGLKLVVVF